MTDAQERQAARDRLVATLEGGWSDDLAGRVSAAFADPTAGLDTDELLAEIDGAVGLMVSPDEAGDDQAFDLMTDAYWMHPYGEELAI